jgi:hypothetical protein
MLKETCHRLIRNSRSQIVSSLRSRWRSPFKCDVNRTRIYPHCGYTVQDRLNRKFSTSKQIFQLVLSEKLVVPGWESFETIPKNWANWSIVEYCIRLGKQKKYESSIKKEFSVIWNWVWSGNFEARPIRKFWKEDWESCEVCKANLRLGLRLKLQGRIMREILRITLSLTALGPSAQHFFVGHYCKYLTKKLQGKNKPGKIYSCKVILEIILVHAVLHNM